MLPPLSITGVSERDIDLLLLEEFRSSPEFLEWFVAQVMEQTFTFKRLLDAQRSVIQSSGESDLEITLEDADGNHVRLLIENKVYAIFQPQQAERYSDRGGNYVKQGECKGFRTVLVAPERYFGNDTALKGFHARITYEVIKEWFACNESMGVRKQYKEALLTAAIEKGTVGYQAVEDAPVTNFWREYWQMAQEYAPELEMKEPVTKPARAGFIYFRPSNFPKRVEIVHKLSHGNVDLQFRGMGERVNELEAEFRSRADSDMKFTKSGKSGLIRLRVPMLNAGIDFANQASDARKCLDAAKKLYKFYLSKIDTANEST